MVDSTLATARERFRLIAQDLAADPPASISAGLTELTGHDSLDELVTRADTMLRAERTGRGDPES
jgi:hypothetical protein